MKRRLPIGIILASLLLITLTSCDLLLQAAIRAAGGSMKEITSFRLTADLNSGAGITTDTLGVISNSEIHIIVPEFTDVTTLIATFATSGAVVTVGSTVQVSGTTANDFTSPIAYRVVAADFSTRTYTARVIVSSKEITEFSFTAALNGAAGLTSDCAGVITGTDIAVLLPYGSDVTSLVATFNTTGTQVTVESSVQVSGVSANDFTNPVVYTVTAADSTTQNFTITVSTNPWHPVGTAGFSPGQVNSLSFAFGPSDTPIVAFSDGANGSKATVMKYEGGSWQTVGSPGFSAANAVPISLAIDSVGTPFVAYTDWANDNKATVMRYDTGLWQTVGTAGFSAGYAGGVSLGLSSLNAPVVAFGDGASSGKLTVMKYASGSWQTIGPAGFTADAPYYMAFALDSLDTPLVAYQDSTNGNKVTVMKYESGSWVMVGTAGFSAGSIDDLSLSISSSDIPYVAFKDGATSGKATVMKYESGSWQTVGSAGFSAGPMWDFSIAINSLGVPYVAFRDMIPYSAKLTVMKYAGGSWQTVGQAGFSAGEAGRISLAFDASDHPFVAYRDKPNGYKATVMKFD